MVSQTISIHIIHPSLVYAFALNEHLKTKGFEVSYSSRVEESIKNDADLVLIDQSLYNPVLPDTNKIILISEFMKPDSGFLNDAVRGVLFALDTFEDVHRCIELVLDNELYVSPSLNANLFSFPENAAHFLSAS